MKLVGIFVAALVALTLFGQVQGAKPAHAGKPTPTGTIAIAAGSQLYLGGTVSFDVTTSDLPGWALPRIDIYCYQSGVMVYAEGRNAEFDGGYLGQPFPALGGGSSAWKTAGGPADCTARLYYWDQHNYNSFTLATVDFAAGG